MAKINRETYASDEEFFIAHWLSEAEEAGLLSGIEYQPESFPLSGRIAVPYTKQLKTKTKKCEKFLFQPHIYTADFHFKVGPALQEFFINSEYLGTRWIIIDVKGSFNKFGDSKQFSINQKWVWDKFGTYVEKIIPEKLFKNTWVPSVCRFSPKIKKPVKKYIGVNTIKEFLRAINQ